MKSIKQGNDIVVTWSLVKEGQPYELEGIDFSLYLVHAFGKTKVTPQNVRGNNIIWTFYGKDQEHTGKYSLELVINEGNEGMASTDYINFVQLTQNTPCCEGYDDENVVTEYVDLTSSVEFAPTVIRESGGLQYATERTVHVSRYNLDGEYEDFEITEEERAYNKETLELAWNGSVVIVFMGNILSCVGGHRNNEEGEMVFNAVCEYDDYLLSLKIIVKSNGDAVYSIKNVDTGSSTPSDMNSDFNNDF